MQGGKVDLLGGDELVVRITPYVFDVVDDEGIAEGVLGKEEDLGAARCEGSNGCFAYTTGAALAVSISL